LSRSTLIAVAGIVVIAVAIGMSVWTKRHEAPTQQSATQVAAPGAEHGNRPSFDVVRINPQGETVIAGRALPKAEVTLLDGGNEIGKVTADNRGEWVFVPGQPLPPGSRELSLKAVNPDGSVTQTDSPVVLVVPPRQNGKGQSLAIKVRPDGSIDVMQGPEAGEGAGALSISGVRYDSRDRLAVAGRAPAKARIQVYLDDKPIGRARADADGRWHIAPKLELGAGEHHIRADQIGDDGKVLARAEITFAPSGTMPAEGKIVVEPGNSLWRIARQVYGSGVEYMSIYQANKDQIRDPNLIYPGQVIEIPTGKTQ
jgi:nucleoid-associated protein YgaU